MSREGWDPINALTMEIYMSKEGWDPLTGLTMKIYMSKEGWDPINWCNHGYLYVNRRLLFL